MSSHEKTYLLCADGAPRRRAWPGNLQRRVVPVRNGRYWLDWPTGFADSLRYGEN